MSHSSSSDVTYRFASIVVITLTFLVILIGAPTPAQAAPDTCWVLNNTTDDFSYRCDFSIIPLQGSNAGAIQDAVFSIATHHFSDYFPFSGCGQVLYVGQTCTLQPGNAPVEVISITSNEFYLLALQGHPEGAGRVIKFAIYMQDNELRLGVRAWGPNTSAAQITVYSGAASALWGGYASNLTGIFFP
jgi:hypothetical protein